MEFNPELPMDIIPEGFTPDGVPLENIFDMVDGAEAFAPIVTGAAMPWYYIGLCLMFIAFCACFVAVILLQKKRAGGFGTVSGMGSTADTYWDRNKGRSREGQLERWTKIGAVVFFVGSLLMCLVAL